MKKRLIIFLIAAVAIFAGLFSLTACGDSPISFKLSFVVDGVVIKVIDTAGNEKIALPDNPEKEDYTFDGWFWDKDVWDKPFTANSLLDTPLSSDMSVYARFKPNHTHEYTERTTIEPTCTGKGEKTFTCNCGDSYTEEINELGHKFTNYISDNNATIEQDGTKTAVCDRGCGVTDTIIDAGSKLPEIVEYFEKRQDGSYYGKVFNSTRNFDFTDKIDYSGDFFVCTDAACTNPLADNKTTLIVGDNIFYVLFDSGNKVTATVRRRMIYTVNFNSDGGTAISSQTVEEDKRSTAPKNPMRVGYMFDSWDYNFNQPITDNTIITAQWKANTNTPYKIEYYLQNLEDDNYTLQESDTENLTGTTDTTITATKTYEHFTLVENTASKNINADGTTVLQVYYNLEKFNVKIYTSVDSVSLDYYFCEQYKYGYIIPEITATYNSSYNDYLGYEWRGWYSNNEFITLDFTIPSVMVDKNIEYCAKGEKEEMANFNFTSDSRNYCRIIGIKDTTVAEIIVPDYVTNIDGGAFSGCSKLERITLPFIGTSKKTTSNSARYPLGYIFGASPYVGGTETLQYIAYSSHTKSSTFYIPSSLKSVTIKSDIFAYSFMNCSNLTSLTITKGVHCIKGTFSSCDSLTNIYFTGTIDEWGSIKFDSPFSNPLYYAHNLYINDELVTEATVTIANDYSFIGCTTLTKVTIDKKVRGIGNCAFSHCSCLTSITIDNSVTSIGNEAFNGCCSIKTVYFKGFESEWNNILISSKNDFLILSTRYYYSEIEPELNEERTAYNGNFWHYDTDGITPVIWTKDD